jgi:protein-tyrosine phosphatase
LAIGSAPPPDAGLKRFDVVVFTAREYQPPEADFPPRSPDFIHAPLHDARPTPDEVQIAVVAGVDVAELVRSGKTVLVTCWQGRNRSGLVTALALCELDDTAFTAISKVRQARGPTALDNRHFVRIICAFDEKRRTL